MYKTLQYLQKSCKTSLTLLLIGLWSSVAIAQSPTIQATDQLPCVADVVTYSIDPQPSSSIAWTLASPQIGNMIINSAGEAVIQYFEPGNTELSTLVNGELLTLSVLVAPEVTAFITS